MALEASHIRFALDIKDKLEVTDLKKYIPGIIYPDSRYVTKIDRELTHPQDLLDNHYSHLDDFNKGCYAHLLYDDILRNYTKQTLSDMFTDIDSSQDSGRELWIRMTALKILQDNDDIKKYDIAAFLPYLDYVENLNGEDRDLLVKYNQYFQKLYAIPQQVSLEKYYDMWRFLGIGEDLGKKTAALHKGAAVFLFILTVVRYGTCQSECAIREATPITAGLIMPSRT